MSKVSYSCERGGNMALEMFDCKPWLALEAMGCVTIESSGRKGGKRYDTTRRTRKCLMEGCDRAGYH